MSHKREVEKQHFDTNDQLVEALVTAAMVEPDMHKSAEYMKRRTSEKIDSSRGILRHNLSRVLEGTATPADLHTGHIRALRDALHGLNGFHKQAGTFDSTHHTSGYEAADDILRGLTITKAEPLPEERAGAPKEPSRIVKAASKTKDAGAKAARVAVEAAGSAFNAVGKMLGRNNKKGGAEGAALE